MSDIQLVNVQDAYQCQIIHARLFSGWGIFAFSHSQIWQGDQVCLRLEGLRSPHTVPLTTLYQHISVGSTGAVTFTLSMIVFMNAD
jgi:hypothetical protein